MASRLDGSTLVLGTLRVQRSPTGYFNFSIIDTDGVQHECEGYLVCYANIKILSKTVRHSHSAEIDGKVYTFKTTEDLGESVLLKNRESCL